MALPQGALNVAREFADAVVHARWTDITSRLAANLTSRVTPDSLAAEFGWDQLGPRLRRMHIDITGEPEEIVPHIDPPSRYEVFEASDRGSPDDHDPGVPVGWVKVEFLPSEDSNFDVCYNCALAMIDEDGPRITAFVIESATE